MMENQQQQTELLRRELTAPKGQRPGNISDFRRLQPAIFTGEEKPLDAEQWLTDTSDLLNAARVPKENQVEVAKIQLKDVARTWWLAEEARLEKPVTWDTFSRVSIADSSLLLLRRTWKSSLSDFSKGISPWMSMPRNFSDLAALLHTW